MNASRRTSQIALALVAAAAVALVAAAGASAHPRVSPAVSLSNEVQLYSLAVPTEKEAKTTTKIVLTVPTGFSIDSFVASPGRERGPADRRRGRRRRSRAGAAGGGVRPRLPGQDRAGRERDPECAAGGRRAHLRRGRRAALRADLGHRRPGPPGDERDVASLGL